MTNPADSPSSLDSQSCETSVQKPRKGFAVIMIEFDDPAAVNAPEKWDAEQMRQLLKAGVEQLIHSMGEDISHRVSVDHFRCILTNYMWSDQPSPHPMASFQHWTLDQKGQEISIPSLDCSYESVENIGLSKPDA